MRIEGINRYITAVDPGKLTGVATFGFGELQTATLEHDVASDWYWGWQNLGQVVVCEKFSVTQRTIKQASGQQLWSVEQIGVLRTRCRQQGIPLVFQSPSDAKSFATNEKLKYAFDVLPSSDHERDAMRHLLLYIVRNNLLPPTFWSDLRP